MKRTALIIIFLIIILCACPSYAEVYTDEVGNLSIDIDYGDNVYYYTTQKNNLFNDLAQKIENDPRNIRFYVTRFSDAGEELYNFYVYSEPMNLKGDNANKFNITAFSEDVKANAVKNTTSALNEYIFSEYSEGVLGGLSSLFAEGINRENTDEHIEIYISADGENYIVTQAKYYDSYGADEIDNLINSLKFSDDIIAASLAEPASNPQDAAPTPAPTVIAEITAVSEEGEQTLSDSNNENKGLGAGIGSFFTGIWDTIVTAYQNDPFFICYIIGAAIILAVIIIIAVTSKKRRFYEQSDESQYEVEEDLTILEDISITPRGDDNNGKQETNLLLADLTADNVRAPRKIVHTIDDTFVYNSYETPNDKTDNKNANEADFKEKTHITEQIELEEEEESDMSSVADFEKDISKYTQQPGKDVNDVSKNTINVYDDNDDFTDALTRSNTEFKSKMPSWKTQGTRMSRHKKKK